MWVSVLLLGLLGLQATACTNPGIPDRPPRLESGTTQIAIQADWDDIDAALSRAAPTLGIAVLGSETSTLESGHTRRTIRVLAIDEQLGEITCTALTDSIERGTGQPIDIVLGATIATPPDTERASAIIKGVAAELAALAGRDIAPRRSPM